MMSIRVAGAFVLSLFAAGCASSTTQPRAIQAMSPDSIAVLRLSAVNCKAVRTVGMGQTDIDRVCLKVKQALEGAAPGLMADPASPDATGSAVMTITFVDYNPGDPRPGGLLAGLGNTMVIDADVLLTDTGDATLGRYRVSKQFAVGGVNRGAPVMEAVEEGFAKSVADIFATRAKK